MICIVSPWLHIGRMGGWGPSQEEKKKKKEIDPFFLKFFFSFFSFFSIVVGEGRLWEVPKYQ